MVCKTCGCKLNETDKFCRYCGTTVPAVPQQPPVQQAAPQAPTFTPTYTPTNQSAPNPINSAPVSQTYIPGQNAYVPPQPKSGKGAHLKPAPKKKSGKKGLLIGGGIAAAVLVIALVVVLIIYGSPAMKVGTAFRNTADEFAKVADVWNMEEAAAFAQKEAVSISADVKLNSINENYLGYYLGYYSEAVSGLGASLDMDVDLENREMGMMATVSLGSADLVTAMVSAEDEMLYVGAPDFLNDFYGVNTETMMRDLDNMGAGMGEAANISFNIFEMIGIVKDYSGDPEEMRQALTDATADLAKELTFEKAGKKTVKVNGESLKCQAFTVTVPQDALEEWFEAVEEVATSADAVAMMEELFRSMNLPEDIVEELMYDMRYSVSEPDYSDVYELFDMLGDVELQLYVKSNKIVGVVYEEKIDGTKLEIGLYLGGERYADNLTLEIKVDGEKLTIESEGDHTAKDGVFTDEMTIKLPDGEKFTMETEYDPKAESDNLTIRFGNDYATINLEGTYAAAQDRYELSFDEFSVVQDAEELFSLAVSYEITDYEKRVKVSDARLLSDLTQEDIMNLAQELEGNALEWIMDLAASHPELLEMLDF